MWGMSGNYRWEGMLTMKLSYHAAFRPLRYLVLVCTVLLFGLNPVFAQSTTEDISASLKQAGVLKIPSFLNPSSGNITINFPKFMGGGKLKFAGTVDADELTNKRFVFSTTDDGKIQWKKAFGVPFIDLTDLSLSLTIAKGEYAIALDGKIGGVFGKALPIVIEIAASDTEITDFVFSLPETTLAMSKVPGMKKIPGVNTFKLKNPTVSLNAIGGEVVFLGQQVDAVAFNTGDQGKWSLALRLDKPLKLGKLIGINKGLLNKIALPRATVFVATEALESDVSDLPLALQQFLEEGDYDSDTISLIQGVTIETAFNPKLMPKDLKAAMKAIGITEKIGLKGEIGGMFGGPKEVKISVELPTTGGNAFSFLKKAPDATTSFFIDMSSAHSGVGIETVVQAKGGKNPMVFLMDFEFRTDETGFSLLAAGAMEGEWKNAAGIKGFTVIDPFMSVSIDTTGAFDVLMDGTYKFGKREVRLTADIVIQPAAAFIPEAFAFAGYIDKLPITDVFALAAKLVKLKSGGLSKINLEFRDVEFAFMSPGSQLPPDLQEKFQLEGSGMALNGALWAHGKELGAVKGFISTKGIMLAGDIEPFDLGPLKLKDASLLLSAGPAVDQALQISGAISLFKGFEESYVLSFLPDGFLFETETKFGGAFDATMIAMAGNTSYGKTNDFTFEAEISASYQEAFKAALNESLKGLKKASAEMKKARTDVDNAQKKVKGLNDKIAAAKVKAEAHLKDAVRSIKATEAKVKGLGNKITEIKKKIHDKKKALKKAAKKLNAKKAAAKAKDIVKLEAELIGLTTAKKTASWALAAAKKAVKGTPTTSPQVVKLQAQLKVEQAALKVADVALKGLLAAGKGLEKAIKAAASQSFTINKLGASGSLLGIVTLGVKGQRPLLIVDVTIAGKNYKFKQKITPGVKDFKKLSKGIADLVAKQLVKSFQ